jgi:hypothetical protein
VTPYTPEEVRDIAGVLQDIAHDLPEELEKKVVLMLECYASDLEARLKIDDYLSQARELWGTKHTKS